MLEGTGYDTRLDTDKLREIKKHFAEVRPRYAEFESKFDIVEPQIFESQIPGGMLSNMENQLREQGAGDRVDEVLAQVPKVREAAGYPPLVTPSSQIVGTQAVFNVMMGEFKNLTGEFADLMLGYYGSTIGQRDDKVVAIAKEHAKKEPIECRPADLLEPEWEDLCAQAFALEGCNESDEDVLTYAMFPKVAPKFFASRAEGPRNVGKDVTQPETAPAAAEEKPAKSSSPSVNYNVIVGQSSHRVTVERL